MGNGKVEVMEELKKCPFCGGEAKFYKVYDFVNRYVVKCTKCYIRIVGFRKEDVIEAWNRRAEE